MSAPANHWKLGLFVVLGAGLMLVTLLFLGARSLQKETVTYKTYFDESVQGLDPGSPVKFRGVTIGNVSAIGIAPDTRHVEVSCELIVSELDALGLNASTATKGRLGRKKLATIAVPPDLRMQLASAGITGVKFILIDYFPVKDNPVRPLPFPVPVNTIPSTPSTLKNVEDAVVKAVDRFPEIADALVLLVGQVNHLIASVDKEALPLRAGETLSKVSDLVVSLQVALKHANVAKLSEGAQSAIAGLNVSVTRLNGILAKLDGDQGLLASTRRATDTVGDVAGGAKGLGGELSETLREVRDAMHTVQRLSEALETDSDMLLKGRTSGKKK